MSGKLKAIVIGIVSIIALTICILIWQVFSTEPESTNKTEENNLGTLPDAKTQEEKRLEKGITVLKQFSDEAILDFWVIKDTNEIFYATKNGKIFRAKKDVDEEVSSQEFGAIGSIEAFSSGIKILMSFGDPQTPQWGIFDIYDRSWKPLPKNIKRATWSSNPEIIYILSKESDDQSLSELNISKNTFGKKILIKNVNLEDITLEFLPPTTLLIKERASAKIASNIYTFDTKSLSFTKLIGPERGLLVKKSDDNNFLFTYSNEKDFRIIKNSKPLNENNIIPIFFNTLPKKCKNKASSTLCFAPNNSDFEEASLPDDYEKNVVSTIDTLYVINTTEELGEALVTTGNELLPAVDGEKPYFINNKVYFFNKKDDLLYELTLPKKLVEKIEKNRETNKESAPPTNNTSSEDYLR